jgi:hypothetical protein
MPGINARLKPILSAIIRYRVTVGQVDSASVDNCIAYIDVFFGEAAFVDTVAILIVEGISFNMGVGLEERVRGIILRSYGCQS